MMLYGVFTLILAAALSLMLWPLYKAKNIPRRQRQLFALYVSVLCVAGAFGIYHKVGSPAIVPLMAEHEANMEAVKKDMIAASEAVKKNPKDVYAWVQLGHGFMESGQWPAAANAFKQAVVLSNGEPMFIMAYAKAMIMEDEGSVDDDSKKSLEMVLLQEPKNAEARYFLALRKFQDGELEAAMKEMKSLYSTLEEGDPLKDIIDEQIGRK